MTGACFVEHRRIAVHCIDGPTCCLAWSDKGRPPKACNNPHSIDRLEEANTTGSFACYAGSRLTMSVLRRLRSEDSPWRYARRPRDRVYQIGTMKLRQHGNVLRLYARAGTLLSA